METLKKQIIILLFLFFLFQQAFCQPFVIKQGELTRDEIWLGKIIIVADVLVPQNITLTILPNTWLIFNNGDKKNIGKFEDKPEIIVEGKINSMASDDNSIKILNINDKMAQEYLNDLKAMTVSAKAINLAPLESEWKTFKQQYAIVWTLVYSIILLSL